MNFIFDIVNMNRYDLLYFVYFRYVNEKARVIMAVQLIYILRIYVGFNQWLW